MKIKVKEHGSKEFYDEFLYITFKYRKIEKNPKKKVHKLTSHFYLLICYSLFLLALSLYFYFKYNDNFYIGFEFAIGCLLLFNFSYLIFVKKQINVFMSASTMPTIDINDVAIEYIDDDRRMSLRWENVSSAIINKYSISFIPKPVSKIIISLSLDYKNDVIKCLEKYDKLNLLVDNSHLYK